AFVDAHLRAKRPYLMGERFTAADAYLFTIVGWSAFTNVDLSPFPNLRAFMDRVGARPKVRAAMQAERMKTVACTAGTIEVRPLRVADLPAPWLCLVGGRRTCARHSPGPPSSYLASWNWLGPS